MILSKLVSGNLFLSHYIEVYFYLEQINDGVNGYIFPKKNVAMITEILSQVISDGKLSSSAQKIGSKGKEQGKNLMVSESVIGYAFLLENIIRLPSATASPKTVAEIPSRLMEKWLWYLFEDLAHANGGDRGKKVDRVLDTIESQWNATSEGSLGTGGVLAEAFSPINWVEENRAEIINTLKRLEEDEVKT